MPLFRVCNPTAPRSVVAAVVGRTRRKPRVTTRVRNVLEKLEGAVSRLVPADAGRQDLSLLAAGLRGDWTFSFWFQAAS